MEEEEEGEYIYNSRDETAFTKSAILEVKNTNILNKFASGTLIHIDVHQCSYTESVIHTFQCSMISFQRVREGRTLERLSQR